MKRLTPKGFFVCLLTMVCFCTQAQPGTTVVLKKTGKYSDRTLLAEKSDTKKFGKVRHAMQNTYTHYNYYFNANNILNNVVARAKTSFRDDYTKLLPFYNYSLSTTAQSGSDIDSVIYHCTAGVLLHDLRNDWIDNLYFILGKAYFYRRNFDSALVAFRFINYAWAPKDDGYDLPMGSNQTGNGVFSIATPEKTGIIHKVFATPPTRNENFLWMARTSIETGNSTQAAGLLQILRSDPKYPQRLQSSLNESVAYLFYNEKRYDSAASNLILALDNADSRLEKARWEYLIAQMQHLAGHDDEAVKYFNKSAQHTTDPIMEVNAYLNSIAIGNDSTGTTTQQKLDALLHMAKKDKYLLYKDIIYYAAAQVELQLGQTPEAIKLLKKSVAANVDNAEQRSRSFLLLADIAYNESNWMNAHNFYDSTQAFGNLKDSLDRDRLSVRQPALTTIAGYLTAVNNEDSLQQLAAMPEAQRTAFLKKALRQIRRSQGLNEEDNSPNYNPAVQVQTQGDLFTSASSSLSSSSSSKDWYFNNTSLKGSGFNTFRQQWGNRPNVDNWRRQSEVIKAAQKPGSPDNADEDNTADAAPEATPVASSIEDLEAGLPLTPEKMGLSQDNIAKALFSSGEVFQNQLENYPAAIAMYQELNKRVDTSAYREQSLFNLYYCYNELGKKFSGDSALALLQKDYPKGKWMAMLKNGGKTPAASSSGNAATKEYEQIYNAFIEGNFAKAKQQKAVADSLYGNSYWTPQLLYIESIYYISQREDSTALKELQNLQTQFASSPLAEKAKTMADVLSRRTQIETYLTNLKITRNEDTSDANMVVNLTPEEAPVKKFVPMKKQDSLISKPINNAAALKVDTVAVKQPATVAKTFIFNAADSQYVALVMDKVAPVYANEAKNAFNRFNKQNYYNQQINITNIKLDERYNIVLMGPFANALDALNYIDKTRPQTAGRILPWLTADRYGYSMISPANFQLLSENKDMDTYKSIIQKALPEKFSSEQNLIGKHKQRFIYSLARILNALPL